MGKGGCEGVIGGKRQTVLVVLLIPARVAGNILGSLLLGRVRLEHLLEELELRGCGAEEEEGEEDGREDGVEVGEEVHFLVEDFLELGE